MVPIVPHPSAYGDLKRDLSPVWDTVIAAMPVLASLVPRATFLARRHEHEWYDRDSRPTATTLTAAIASTTATTLSVASKKPFKINTTIRFEGYKEQMQVVGVSPTENKITVARGYGGSPKESAIEKDATIKVVNHPKPPGSPAARQGETTKRVKRHNYCEIFDGELLIPRSQSADYNVPNSEVDPVGAAAAWELENEMLDIARRLNSALIYGYPKESTDNDTPGTMGGMLYHHRLGNNIVDAQGSPLTKKHLSRAFRLCFEGGADSVDTMLCNVGQAERISDLYETKLTIVREDPTYGHVIKRVQPGFPIDGYITNIVVDPDFPSDALSIFALKRVLLVFFRQFFDEPATLPGDDNLSRRVIGELTAEFHNWPVATALIEGLEDDPAPDPAPAQA